MIACILKLLSFLLNGFALEYSADLPREADEQHEKPPGCGWQKKLNGVTGDFTWGFPHKKP